MTSWRREVSFKEGIGTSWMRSTGIQTLCNNLFAQCSSHSRVTVCVSPSFLLTSPQRRGGLEQAHQGPGWEGWFLSCGLRVSSCGNVRSYHWALCREPRGQQQESPHFLCRKFPDLKNVQRMKSQINFLLHQNLRQGDKALDLLLGDPHGDLYTNQSIINSEKGWRQ